MSDQRSRAGESEVVDAVTSSRRRVVAGLGAGVVAALAGCSGGDRGPSYERRTVGDVQGDPRNATEMATAQAAAGQEIDPDLSPLDAVEVEDHEFVYEDGYLGSTVQGTLTNGRDDRLRSVEVRVRVYDDANRLLGRYVASTGDLPPNSIWKFQVVLLVSPGGVGAYELAALGMSA